jgi:hypothetical protein
MMSSFMNETRGLHSSSPPRAAIAGPFELRHLRAHRRGALGSRFRAADYSRQIQESFTAEKCAALTLGLGRRIDTFNFYKA